MLLNDCDLVWVHLIQIFDHNNDAMNGDMVGIMAVPWRYHGEVLSRLGTIAS